MQNNDIENDRWKMNEKNQIKLQNEDETKYTINLVRKSSDTEKISGADFDQFNNYLKYNSG